MPSKKRFTPIKVPINQGALEVKLDQTIPNENRYWQPIPVRFGIVSAPGLIIYRFSRDLFYANASFFSEEVQNLVKKADSPVQWLIVESRAITEIDYSASQTVRDVVKELSVFNVTFVLSGLPPQVKAQFDRDGLTDLIGAKYFFNHLEEALAAFHIIHDKSAEVNLY